MTLIPQAPQTEVEYPESDGKPMGETDVHIRELIEIRTTLFNFFSSQPDIYVAADLLFYYEEGNPKKFVVPDVFVVKGLAKGLRRTYKLWVEGRAPNVIFEITSRSTKRQDVREKHKLYAELGVNEYFIYDPLEEYLKPPLQGFQLLRAGEYEPILPDEQGRLLSQELSLWIMIETGYLRLIDVQTGQKLLWTAEEKEARFFAELEAEFAERKAETEAQARQVAEQQARAEAEARQLAEAEIARLKAEIARLKGQ